LQSVVTWYLWSGPKYLIFCYSSDLKPSPNSLTKFQYLRFVNPCIIVQFK
jgi:hypothetical protein